MTGRNHHGIDSWVGEDAVYICSAVTKPELCGCMPGMSSIRSADRHTFKSPNLADRRQQRAPRKIASSDQSNRNLSGQQPNICTFRDHFDRIQLCIVRISDYYSQNGLLSSTANELIRLIGLLDWDPMSNEEFGTDFPVG